MKIAFPTQDNKGMDSLVYGHFGSAPNFILVDSEDNSFEAVENPEREHLHGQCQPVSALGGKTVDAIAVGGIGAGALMKLGAAGIKTYRAVFGTVTENFDLIMAGTLPLITLDQTCQGHGAGSPCTH